jgi:hypothetical protein
MKTNVGTEDMIVRILIALVLFSLAVFLEGNARWWALAGFVPLLTGALRFCPLYTIFGLSTCPLRKSGA